MASLYRLTYTSRRDPAFNSVQIIDILQACKRNNPLQGITGILFFDNSNFLQRLEGTESGVKALVEKLKQDDRHGDFQVLEEGPMTQRQFKLWSMYFIDGDSVRRHIARITGREDDGLRDLDVAGIHRLVAAISHGDALNPRDSTQLAPSAWHPSYLQRCWQWLVGGTPVSPKVVVKTDD